MYLQQSLCEDCARIELYPPAERSLVRRYSSLEELTKLAETGCAFCSLVFNAHQCWDHGSHENVVAIEIEYQKQGRHGNGAAIGWNCRRRGGWSSNPVGEVFTYPDDPAAKHICYRPLERDPRSPKSHRLFRSWVQECNTSHPDCVERRNMPLPTRVIDVGLGDNPREPRLHIPDAASKGMYATLSYCWGTSHNATLTSDNLAERLQGIPLEELPQTLRDAIEVARELEIPYLWIDALCILQDSLEDWQKESAKMGDVYSNSFLTIQAAGADDATKGCFLPRATNPYDGFPIPGRPVLPYQPPVMLPFVDGEGIKGSVYVRFGSTPDEQVISPAQLRGWICQESLLSPRVLAFGAYKLFWECATAYRDESGTEAVNYGTFPGLPKPIRRVGAIAPQEESLTPLQKLWYYVVTEYSHRKLRYPNDKLPALAGIAQHVSLTRPGDEYCAGLWRNDMPANLMWSVALEHDLDGGLVGGPLETYRSPSWSWAAWDGLAVPYQARRTIDGVFEVIDVSMTLSGLNPFGEVSAGELRVRGLLRQGWRIRSHRLSFPQILLNIDTLPDPDKLLEYTKGLVQEDYRNRNEPDYTPFEVWFLRVETAAGLVLEMQDDGTFRRTGLFRLSRERTGTPVEDWFRPEDLQTLTIV